MMKTGHIHVSDLTGRQKNEMFLLMQRYYENVSFDQFNRDLWKKDRVVYLTRGGRIRGFSTQVTVPVDIDGQPVNVVFSGDTVVDEQCRNSVELPFEWIRMMCSLLDKEPDTALYWLLTTKGYKTYRVLPAFFRDFTPSWYRKPSEFERDIMAAASDQLFPGRFDRVRSLLHADKGSQRLRPGAAEITDERRKDCHVRFFECVNPGHAYGDELVCLARFACGNLRSGILRRLEQGVRPQVSGARLVNSVG